MAADDPKGQTEGEDVEHPNNQLVRRYFEAAEAGDLDVLDEVFSDDVVAHIGGDHALSGDHQGKAAVFGFFQQLGERSAGTARLRPQESLANDWFAVALVEVAGHVGDETLQGEQAVVVFRIEDGRFAEFWSHHYDQEKMNRAWS